MAGRQGTTAVAELNRLANGGASYPSESTWLDEAGAADKWCTTTRGEAVAALNVKAGNTVANFKDWQGVCNQLAGTDGLGPAEALRRINA